MDMKSLVNKAHSVRVDKLVDGRYQVEVTFTNPMGQPATHTSIASPRDEEELANTVSKRIAEEGCRGFDVGQESWKVNFKQKEGS